MIKSYNWLLEPPGTLLIPEASGQINTTSYEIWSFSLHRYVVICAFFIYHSSIFWRDIAVTINENHNDNSYDIIVKISVGAWL